ncbi:unnamed protein product [Dimorphilus gyrociliatus]|uniref:Uncharacterized protein n=1 Tax=Dimorphilus gyrociliatus TaxID=2664684 RepID=A0A7I8V7A2_9ANNE|nr:unnamed protein product [Dimorphilus gyrociliatus]
MVNPTLKKALFVCLILVGGVTFKHILRLSFPSFQIKISVDDKSKIEVHNISKVIHRDHHSNNGLTVQNSIKPLETDGQSIAIGMGITSRRMPIHDVEGTLRRIPLFRHFLPSFCKTVTVDWQYNFYFGYDVDDGFFISETKRQAFIKRFQSIVQSSCPPNIIVLIHLVHCDHKGSPTWAQNDAMIEAYIDDNSYYYRVNDDSLLKSTNWAEAFVKVLNEYDPKNVGVVGPHHKGGNEAILTYDFVHKTHLDIFGFYYPRVFTDWWGDDWVTKVYRPGRSTKLFSIKLVHTLDTGTRYKVHTSVEGKLANQLNSDKVTLYRYIEAVKRNKDLPDPDGTKIIAMSLPAKSKKHLYGALRNIQLVKVFMPEWILRLYVAEGVPQRWLNKFKLLKAQIVQLPANNEPFELQPFKIIEDSSVNVFIIRNATSRLSERDATVVKDWVSSQAAFHCIRDHPRHKSSRIAGIGTIGGRREKLNQRLSEAVTKFSQVTSSWNWLQTTLFDLVKADMLCHDSVSCTDWPNSRHFTQRRFKSDFIGRVYNERMNPDDKTAENEVKSHPDPPECTKTTQ